MNERMNEYRKRGRQESKGGGRSLGMKEGRCLGTEEERKESKREGRSLVMKEGRCLGREEGRNL